MSYTTQTEQKFPDEGDFVNGVYEVKLGGRKDHSISFNAGSLTAGSLALTAILKGSSAPETIVDADNPVVIDLAAVTSVSISNKAIDTLILTATGVTGSGQLGVTPSGD